MLQSNGEQHSDRWALGWTAFFLFFLENEAENCANQKL
jgi:hypothetical protein